MFVSRHHSGRVFVPFVLMVCICANAFGCAGVKTSAGSDAAGSDDRQRPETRAEESYVPSSMMMTSPEPPGSTLSYGKDAVEAGIGTYCWSTARGGACVDVSGTNAGEDELVVPAGAVMSFVYKGKKLDSLGISARNGLGAKDLKVRRSGTRARIVADLPPGEYLLDVFATMPEGDVSYGFGLVVKP